LLKEGILSALRADAEVFESPISTQFLKLIVDPVSKLPTDLVVTPVVSIIDAVDECGNASTREPLLQCLKDVCRLPSWFKVLVTSRPDRDITTYLAGVSSGLEVVTQNEQSILDINAYTRGRLQKLRIERSLSSDWPGEPKVDELCSRAEGLFIWTALSFRLMSQEPSPTKALQRVLRTTEQSHLDGLYHTLINSGPAGEDREALIRSFLGVIVVAKRSLSLSCIGAFLDIDNEEATWASKQLVSVLFTDPHSGIRVTHPSSWTFLPIANDQTNLLLMSRSTTGLSLEAFSGS
jgi:hypothetical protein